jgi:ubiquinone/menaquinone biosynthesis C-methylase UbiE
MIYNKSIDWSPAKAVAFLNENRVKKMIAMVHPGIHVTELGSFTGDIAQALKMLNNNTVIGIDCNRQFKKMCEQKGIPMFLCDLEKELPIGHNFTNTVLAGEIIEHIVHTETLLDECHRILSPGGELIISTPNLAYLGHRIKLLFGKSPAIIGFESGEADAGPGHVRYFSVQTLTELLQKHGFKVVLIDGSDILGNSFLGSKFPSLSYHIIVKAVRC